MTALRRSPLVVVWAALMIATCASWYLGHDDSAHTVATVLVLVIAFVKVHYIGRWFMALREAPVALRVVFDAWVALVGTLLIVLYVAG